MLVRRKEDIPRILEMIKEISPDEMDYFPGEEIFHVWNGIEKPPLTYTYKYEGPTTQLEARCWSECIWLKCITGFSEDTWDRYDFFGETGVMW